MDKQDVRDRLGNVDQIRDILFGSQQRDYEQRFGQLEAELGLVSRDLQAQIEEAKAALSDQLRLGLEALEKRLKQAASTNEQSFADLRQQSDRINRRLESGLSDLDQTFEAKMTALGSRLSETREKLGEDVRSLRLQVFQELDRRLGTLQEGKVARQDLAEILFELGMRLKGEEVVPALKAAVEVYQPEVLSPAPTPVESHDPAPLEPAPVPEST